MSLSALMTLGATIAQATYRKTSDRAHALGLLDAWATRDRTPSNASFIQWLGKSPGHVHRTMWAARWASAGFPQVVVGHKLAASLMATRIPPEVLAEDEPPPWPAYAVILPNGLVPVHDRIANREGFASYVFVERHPKWVLFILEAADTAFFMVRHADSLADAIDEHVNIDLLGEVGDFRAEARDARVLEQIARLAIGVELELRDRTNARAPRPRKGSEPGRAAAEPATQTFVLTRNVVVNCRRGDRSPPPRRASDRTRGPGARARALAEPSARPWVQQADVEAHQSVLAWSRGRANRRPSNTPFRSRRRPAASRSRPAAAAARRAAMGQPVRVPCGTALRACRATSPL